MTATDARKVPSPAQLRIVALIECGYDTEGIADALGVSPWRVRDQIRTVRWKVGGINMLDLPDACRAAGYDIPICGEGE